MLVTIHPNLCAVFAQAPAIALVFRALHASLVRVHRIDGGERRVVVAHRI